MRQQPIGSGFGTYSTIDDVLSGVDLTGRRIVVTGGYSGLGLELTRGLTAVGAVVLVPARRPHIAERELAGLPGAQVLPMDLTDMSDVVRTAEQIVTDGKPVHTVIANAGVMACPYRLVAAGWESQFATNHLGHFAFVNALWPAIEAGAGRVVSVSSSGHQHCGIRWGDVHFASAYDPRLAYGQSKTANILFAKHLDALAAPRGVRAFSLHPGGILTPLQRHMTHRQKVDAGWIDEDGTQIAAFLRTPSQGAATAAWAATSSALDGYGGQYLVNCDISEIARTVDVQAGRVMLRALDPAEAEKLWQYSAELTAVGAF